MSTSFLSDIFFLLQKDGKAKGPNAFEGPIGKMLPSCESLPVVNFQPNPCQELESLNISNDLITDQKYLAEICVAVVWSV